MEGKLEIYEGDDLYKLFTSLKNSNRIMETDILTLAPNDGSFFIIMTGNSRGLKMDLNNPEDIIRKLPGGRILYDAFKKFEWRKD